MKNYDEERF